MVNEQLMIKVWSEIECRYPYNAMVIQRLFKPVMLFELYTFTMCSVYTHLITYYVYVAVRIALRMTQRPPSLAKRARVCYDNVIIVMPSEQTWWAYITTSSWTARRRRLGRSIAAFVVMFVAAEIYGEKSNTRTERLRLASAYNVFAVAAGLTRYFQCGVQVLWYL